MKILGIEIRLTSEMTRDEAMLVAPGEDEPSVVVVTGLAPGDLAQRGET